MRHKTILCLQVEDAAKRQAVEAPAPLQPPGGNPGPSQEDRLLTEELQRLAPRMGLRFLDHVIVTDGDCYSITQSQRI